MTAREQVNTNPFQFHLADAPVAGITVTDIEVTDFVVEDIKSIGHDGDGADFGDYKNYSLAWLRIFHHAFNHKPFTIEAYSHGRLVGLLPLAEVKSMLFGRYLVSLPYLNQAGVWATQPTVARALVDEAVRLADQLEVRYLELRHDSELLHPALQDKLTAKVQMRLSLPTSSEELWKQLKPKVRNQIRKGERQDSEIRWGGGELLSDFYRVFSRNMRDLGTPVYGKRFFEAIVKQLSDHAELCSIRIGGKPVAAALLLHRNGTTEVPSASSLRAYNSTNVNMLLYWNLLVKAVERGSDVFDFGRSTVDGNTFRFKKQWGAVASQSVWQYYVREGECNAVRPENSKYSMAINVWRRLPVSLTQWIGPMIVRGIP